MGHAAPGGGDCSAAGRDGAGKSWMTNAVPIMAPPPSAAAVASAPGAIGCSATIATSISWSGDDWRWSWWFTAADPAGAAGRLADWLRGQSDFKWSVCAGDLKRRGQWAGEFNVLKQWRFNNGLAIRVCVWRICRRQRQSHRPPRAIRRNWRMRSRCRLPRPRQCLHRQLPGGMNIGCMG